MSAVSGKKEASQDENNTSASNNCQTTLLTEPAPISFTINQVNSTNISEFDQNTDCLIELQPSTSKSNEVLYEEVNNSYDLINLSDLDDSVADEDYFPSDPDNNSSSSDDNQQTSISLRHYQLFSQKTQFETHVIDYHDNTNTGPKPIANIPGPKPTSNNPTPILTDELISETANLRPNDEKDSHYNIFVANYPGPIFINEDEAQKHFTKHSKRSLKQRSKHPIIINSCKGKCGRKCMSFTLGERIEIWMRFWDLDFPSRRSFLNKCVQITGVKKRKTEVNTDRKGIKKESRFYYFPENGRHTDANVPVCRKFFLDTLGYATDAVITELSKALKNDQLLGKVTRDFRGGKRKQAPTMIMEQHINSYQPVVSHYRRKNAPNVKYLPRTLTLTAMYADFKNKHPDIRCSVEVYRQTIKKNNISFYMPQGDKCGDCAYYEEEEKKYSNENIEVPEDFKMKRNGHKQKANQAIERYRIDALKGNETHIKYYAMDLQKVILLPDMPQHKDAFFLSRLIVFNLTFAPLEKKSNDPSLCVLWHEAIAGRDASNIVNAVKAVFDDQRDVRHFHLWADNCTAQNKNWTLFTALGMIVNTRENEIESVTISYLTKGHTHMAADAVHANIEQKMKRQRGIYDFSDFKDCVLRSRKNIKIIDVDVGNCKNWPKKKKVGRAGQPLKSFQLKTVVQVKFVNGSRNLFCKNRFDDDWEEVDFLLNKFDIYCPPSSMEGPRGVKEVKKRDIITKLVPLMPESRRSFWNNLPTNDGSVDLSFVPSQIEEQ